MVDIGILEEFGASKGALLCFIIPKKDSLVRLISDLQLLNKCVKCKKYPLPVIQDIMHCVSGYKYSTKLVISMQNYTFEFDNKSQDLCVIIIPFGKYKYKSLPLGLNAHWILCNKLWKKSSMDWKHWPLCQHVGRTPPVA